MKYVSRISLVKGESLLSKEEMKKIVGKGTYRCCCGMDGNAPCFNVTVPTVVEREDLSLVSMLLLKMKMMHHQL